MRLFHFAVDMSDWFNPLLCFDDGVFFLCRMFFPRESLSSKSQFGFSRARFNCGLIRTLALKNQWNSSIPFFSLQLDGSLCKLKIFNLYSAVKKSKLSHECAWTALNNTKETLDENKRFRKLKMNAFYWKTLNGSEVITDGVFNVFSTYDLKGLNKQNSK